VLTLHLHERWLFLEKKPLSRMDSVNTRSENAVARSPGMGHQRKDPTDFPLMFWPVGAYLILYRVQNERVEIVAVTQGSRDIPSFLRRRVL
jgi:antitoxin ParD1/3/4/toxin ParE1/3/4